MGKINILDRDIQFNSNQTVKQDFLSYFYIYFLFPCPYILFFGNHQLIQNTNLKEYKTPMFTAALFIITKIWKHPKCLSVDERIKQLWDIILGCKKEENVTFCNGMHGSGEHYAKWNKPVRKRQISYDFSHMCNLMNKLN